MPKNDTYNLQIFTTANGTVSYEVYASATGAFEGEETKTQITANSTNISAFSGKYFWIQVICEQTTGINFIERISVKIDSSRIQMVVSDVDTSTLSGSNTARNISSVLPRTLSYIYNIQITPKTVTAYNMDVYVTATPQSTHVVPKVISKSASAPTIALVGMDNQPRDATVDLLIQGLPEQYMSGSNLLVR
jgi:hypothetical protein